MGFAAVHAADLAAFFGRERGVLLTYGAQTFDLELADAGDYQVVYQFFRAVEKYYAGAAE